MFKAGNNENVMFFFNKPPKWNEGNSIGYFY